MTYETMSAADVAETFGIARATFLHRRAELERKHGFPPPLPIARPYRWRAEAVRKWHAAWDEAGPKQSAADLRQTVITQDRALLLSRYAAANHNGAAA
ncbi:MAG: hypothetical protein CMH13_11125 [Martelella sp.]|uniref:hypothetical protein n=1 Tax=Martelella sp. TaxID=1969699 RepID=UPI000C4D5771|nr:hypothetical protein [Martelella sp.]MAU21071.1 hypothetical protein [Martelella sp.]